MTSPQFNNVQGNCLKPSWCKFLIACSVGQNNTELILSVRIRLISSGIFILYERSPASICATRICNLLAAKAPARVEFVSP